MIVSRGSRQRCGSPFLEALEPRILLNAVRMPWLAGVTETAVWVSLEATNNTQNAVVDFGLTPSYGSQAVTQTAQATASGYYVHNVQLTGLLPNTQYHYRVTHGSSVSADYAFWTAPQPGTSAHWGFAADCRTDTAWHNTMAGLIDARDPRMMVYGGDLPTSGTWAYWNSDWFVTNQNTLNATTPWVNAPGNHEGWNSLTVAFTQSPEGDGVGGNGYFSFDYADSHIVVINNLTSYYKGSDQWNWVAADLAASDAAWKIVTCHYPSYAYGSHGSDPTMQQMASELFEPNGVALTLFGHNHYYQHNLVNGIHHMTIGSFGVAPSAPSSGTGTIYSETTRCFGIIDTTPTTLTLTTYRQDGSVIETIQLLKDTTPPTVPGYPVAVPQNDTTVQVAWIASSDPQSGVDHYNIYRSGQFLASTTRILYNDTGVEEQTFYSYRISAVNGDGLESAQSAPAYAYTPEDTTPPTIVSASWADADQVNVLFSESVEESSAENVGNYFVYAGDQWVVVYSATLQADNRTVAMNVSKLSETKTYTVKVSSVFDRAVTPLPVAPGSQATFAFQGWASQDIGVVDAAGVTSYSAGTYTIQSDGGDIYNTSDQFRYVYTTLAGDGEIIARVAGLPNVSVAKCGVMMRDSLEPSSEEVSMVLGAQTSQAYLQYRTSFGGSTGYTAANSINAPYYVRLVRSGSVISGYVSATGQAGTWTQVGSGVSVAAMASGTIYVGLASCNQAQSGLSTFVMDNVRLIEPGPANVAPAGVADSYVVGKDSSLVIAPQNGVLVNDSDSNQDSLSAALIGGVSHGSLTLQGNGSFNYTPTPGFLGTDGFTYTAGDGALASGSTAVTLRVAIPGDANLEGLVDTQDFTILKAYFGQSPRSWAEGDFNGDQLVDTQDFTLLKAHFGEKEPAAGATEANVPLAAFVAYLSGLAPDAAAQYASGSSPAPRGLAQAAGRLIDRASPQAQTAVDEVLSAFLDGRLPHGGPPSGRLPAPAATRQAAEPEAGTSSDDLSAIGLDEGLIDVLAELDLVVLPRL